MLGPGPPIGLVAPKAGSRRSRRARSAPFCAYLPALKQTPPAHPPAGCVVTVGLSARSHAEPPGRGRAGWSSEPTLRSFLVPRNSSFARSLARACHEEVCPRRPDR
eukprot:11899629-Alexandrium_andersonii.AAC.2